MLSLLPIVVLAAAAAAITRTTTAAPAVAAAATSLDAGPALATLPKEVLERKLVELLYKLQQQRDGGASDAGQPPRPMPAHGANREPAGRSGGVGGDSSSDGHDGAADRQDEVDGARDAPDTSPDASAGAVWTPPTGALPPREVEKHSAYTNKCRGKFCQGSYMMGTRQSEDDGNDDNTSSRGALIAAAPRSPPVSPRASDRGLRLELLKRKLVDLYELVDSLERDETWAT